MAIIKKIIMWIINFFKRLFKGKSKKNSLLSNKKKKPSLPKEKLVKTSLNTTMPSYMMISDQDKLSLIEHIHDAKHKLQDDTIKKKSIKKIIALLTDGITDNTKEDKITSIYDYLNKQDLDKLNIKRLEELLNDFDSITKEKVYEVLKENKVKKALAKLAIHNLDEMEEYINNHDISFELGSLINDEISNTKLDSITEKDELCNKDFINTVKNFNKNIVDEVKTKYQRVNYVTLSTVTIDKIITRYQQLEDDYMHHRYNKYYYEKELNILKERINYLKSIKNSSAVYNEIERLRKELYTKSKDKYDILYNNEIFLNIEKKCDELLDKVNAKVVDIKKKEEVVDKKNEKEEYINKIILRFKDLALARHIILMHKETEDEALDYANILLYIDKIYGEFINGVDDKFNYQRNKTKTELVKLYNDLNNVIARVNRTSFVSIDHINFRMNDLVEAVRVKKEEVEREVVGTNKLSNSELVDEKIDAIKDKFIGKEDPKKVLKKTN